MRKASPFFQPYRIISDNMASSADVAMTEAHGARLPEIAKIAAQCS
jgi:hypothetical protein